MRSTRLAPVRTLLLAAVLNVLSGEWQIRADAPAPVEDAIQVQPVAPDWLPKYFMDVRIDPGCQKVTATQRVVWTNPGDQPTNEIAFHVYPQHRPNEKQLTIYQRTLESFRLDPRIGIDRHGRRVRFQTIQSGDVPLTYRFDEKVDTVLHVDLPQPVKPGQTVEVYFEYSLDIPAVQGRFGRWMGITNLLHWYPTVAYFGPNGWDAPPYVAWHQPFLNEAGHYDVKLTVPPGEMVACSGQVVETSLTEDGWQNLHVLGTGLRDFAIVLSKRFEIHEEEVDGIRVQVYAFPEHRFYARQALATAREVLPMYNQWFGRYPHAEFRIAEAFFGWNGNETSGMVLIDHRVFDAPQVGHIYVDSLVSHEICHQWWYATVGTDGFRETWMDEGLVSHLTQVRMENKYGADVSLLDWPKFLNWLPNIGYRPFVHNGYYLYLFRGGKESVLGELPDIGNVHYLFFLAYDRGNKVFEMLHHRLGDELFFKLLRSIYVKYGYRILFVEQFQKEVEQLTNEDWSQFFDDWLRSPKIADWKIKKVKIHPEPGMCYYTTIDVVQTREINEPVNIAIWTDDSETPHAQVSLIPEAKRYELDGVHVEHIEGNCWRVSLTTDKRPCQIIVDPEQHVLDANLANNRWKPEPRVKFTPLYTPLDETPIAQPLDRVGIVFGPNIDAEGRIGFRGSVNSMNRYRVSPFLAYTHDDAHTTVGVDSRFYNFPAPNLSVGARYEHTIDSGLFNEPTDQAKLYLRWHQAYTTSFIFEDLAYAEVYFRVGDNFFPDEDFRPPENPLVEDYRNIRAVGVSYHVNTQMPYWNPETGFQFDITYERGFVLGGKGETYDRVWSQLSGVKRLESAPGYLAETRLAGRIAGGIGSPDNGEHFRFGGPLRFRGQRSEDTEGNMFWLASTEWRFPLLTDMDNPLIDNFANFRSLYGAIFYDVGESYLFGDSQGVDHALGAGLYFRISLVSFLEQLTLRVEYGQSLRNESRIAWFGLYHAF